MTGLAETLGELLTALEGLQATLTRETEVLRQAEADALLALTEAKSPQLSRISQCWADLTRALGQNASASMPNLSTHIATRGDTDARRLWARIETLAAEVSRQNRLNGELIQDHLRHNHAAQQILRDAARRHGLYGADGQSLSMFPGQRTIDEV